MCFTHSNNKIKLREKPLRLHWLSGIRMNLRKQPRSPVKLCGETFPKQCHLCKWTVVFTPPWTNQETNHQTKWPENKYIKSDLPGRIRSLCIHFHTLRYMHFVCETGLLTLGVTLLIVNYNKQSSDYLRCCTILSILCKFGWTLVSKIIFCFTFKWFMHMISIVHIIRERYTFIFVVVSVCFLLENGNSADIVCLSGAVFIKLNSMALFSLCVCVLAF